MARTSEMRLIELMVLKEDIASVLEFIGKRGTFQFLGKPHEDKKASDSAEDEIQLLMDTDCQYYEELLKASVFFGIETGSIDVTNFSVPTAEDRTKANKFLVSYIHQRGLVNLFHGLLYAAPQPQNYIKPAKYV